MRRYGVLSLFAVIVGSSHAATGPTVSNVSAAQETEGAKRLVITYDVADADSSIVDVTFAMSADGGTTYDIIPSFGACSGDIGQVTPDTGKTIYWDVMADYSEQSGDNYRVRVTADDLGLIVDLGGGVTMEFVYIPAGSFEMGSNDPGWSYIEELPVHTVTFAQGFYMGKYEVTQNQWQAIMGSIPSYNQSCGECPVEFYYRNDCQTFIDSLNAHIASTGQGPATFRLPSEAEWEYACRAGTTTRFSFGDSTCSSDYYDCDPCDLSNYAWWCGNRTSEGYPDGTKPVGLKLPNPWGLYDMHGNMWECCQDWWHGSYNGAPTDGSAWVAGGGSCWVIRGSVWHYDARRCRSSFRYGYYPDASYFSIGFRLSRSVAP